MNPYEEACARFDRISEDYPKIQVACKYLMRWADEEYQAATDNLRQYEVSPGIPKPEYRRA